MNAVPDLAAMPRASVSPKREQVLDAAERCFVRSGFHRATMQDIAREAAMSPANIYRYFDSKESVVLGLADRERARGEIILRGLEQASDRREAFLGLISQFFRDLTRDEAVLQVEIWAEASRNPAIAAMVSRGETETRAWFVDMLTSLARSPHCEAATLYERLHPQMKGLIVSRAVLPDYDPEPALAQIRATIENGLAAPRQAEEGRTR